MDVNKSESITSAARQDLKMMFHQKHEWNKFSQNNRLAAWISTMCMVCITWP